MPIIRSGSASVAAHDDNVHVAFAILVFRDRVQLSLSSGDKPGVWLEVNAKRIANNSATEAAALPLPSVLCNSSSNKREKRVFTVRTVLGQEQEEVTLAARRLAEESLVRCGVPAVASRESFLISLCFPRGKLEDGELLHGLVRLAKEEAAKCQ